MEGEGISSCIGRWNQRARYSGQNGFINYKYFNMSKLVDTLKKVMGLVASSEVGAATMGTVIRELDKLDECRVRIWREDKTVKLPTYAHKTDACMDLYVHSIEFKDSRVIYHTGIHVALPEDYEMEIRPRSGMTKTLAIQQNTPGTVDEGYRGEILVIHRDLIDPTEGYARYDVGDRIAQIIVRRRERIVWDEVNTLEDLGEADRGDNGFGSTGR